jgi:hypothetical protein
MTDDHHDEERPEYDPANVDLPEQEPPLRTTAPQSDYTQSHVGFGLVVFLVGVAVTFGLPLLL